MNSMHSEMPPFTDEECKKSIILVLNNFRTYADATIKLPLNGVTLINGPSGVGKTTIFEAFIFVLFNGIKNPEGFNTKRCWAWLFIGDLIIYRQKDPLLIKVWRKNAQGPGSGLGGIREYVQNEAQQLIDSIYGSQDIFFGCSYLRQKEFSVFLTGTDAEKLAIVKSVATKGAELDEIKGPIKQAQTAFNENFTALKAQFDMAIRSLQQFDHNNPSIIKHQIPENPQEVLRQVQQLRSQLPDLEAEYEVAVKREATIGLIRQQLDAAQNRKQQSQRRVVGVEIGKIKLRLEQIETRLKEFSGVNVDAEKLAKAQIFKTWSAENGRFESKIKETEGDLVNVSGNIKKSLAEFPVFPQSPNQTNLGTQTPEQDTSFRDAAEFITKIKGQLEEARKISTEIGLLLSQIGCSSIEDARFKITSIDGELDKSKKREIDIKIELEKARTANKMKCPQCSTSLIVGLDGKHLEKCDDPPAGIAAMLGGKDDKIITGNSSSGGGGVMGMVASVTASTSNPSPQSTTPSSQSSTQSSVSGSTPLAIKSNAPLLTHDDLLKVAGTIATLTSQKDRLTVIVRAVEEKLAVDPGVDVKAASSNLAMFAKYLDLKKTLDALREYYSQHVARRPEEVKESIVDTTEKNILEAERAGLLKHAEEYAVVMRFIEGEDLNINHFSQMMTEASSKPGLASVEIRRQKAVIQGQIDQLMHLNNASELVVHRTLLEKTMNEKSQQARHAQLEWEAATRLLTKASEAERQSLQAAMAEINTYLNQILKRLFTNIPISVEISTTKELKSKKGGVSQRFDIKIFYNNSEYGSANQLSGGEKDRLSLAITLAMSQKFGGGLLFLDETLSSLDTELKSEAVALLKEFCVNRTIVCVAHEETEGIYNHVIRIKSKSI